MSSRISTWYRFSRSTQLWNTSAPRTRECPRLRRKSPGSPADMPASPRRQPEPGQNAVLHAAAPYRPTYGRIRPRIMTMAIKRATPMATYRSSFAFSWGFLLWNHTLDAFSTLRRGPAPRGRSRRTAGGCPSHPQHLPPAAAAGWSFFSSTISMELQVHWLPAFPVYDFLISSQYRRAACSVLLSPYW